MSSKPKEVLQKEFYETLNYYIKEDTASWLPNNMDVIINSRRSFMLSRRDFYSRVEIQRGELFLFFCKCLKGTMSSEEYIQDKSTHIRKMNQVIAKLLEVIKTKIL